MMRAQSIGLRTKAGEEKKELVSGAMGRSSREDYVRENGREVVRGVIVPWSILVRALVVHLVTIFNRSKRF